MSAATLLERARQDAGLSQAEAARRGGTSRPTLSAYERGRKSPTLDTAIRLLAAVGSTLETAPEVSWNEVSVGRGRTAAVPSRLSRLPLRQAMAQVVLPLHLNWSAPGQPVNLAARRERARLYEVVLREGRPQDIARYVDGALLIDLWDELVLPRAVRSAWEPVVTSSLLATAV